MKKFKTIKTQNEIGILYELAYGYSLLNEAMYLNQAKIIVKELMKDEHKYYLDKLYIKKGKMLLKILP